jgi:hypothetical protein
MGHDMLVVNRFIAPTDGAAETEFTDHATAALEVLAAQRGYVRGDLGRAYDDPAHWILVTEWESVGAYRRALGTFDVKVHATPLLAQSVDEPSAFEVLASAEPGGAPVRSASDRSAAGATGPGAGSAAPTDGGASALRSRP